VITLALLQLPAFERFLAPVALSPAAAQKVFDNILTALSGVAVASRMPEHLDADFTSDVSMAMDTGSAASTLQFDSSSSSSSSSSSYVPKKPATMTSSQFLREAGHVERSAVFSPAEIALMTQLQPTVKPNDWQSLELLFNAAADAAPQSSAKSEHIGRKDALQLKAQHEK